MAASCWSPSASEAVSVCAAVILFPSVSQRNTPQSNHRKQCATIKRNPFEELGAKDRLAGMKLCVFMLGFVDPFYWGEYLNLPGRNKDFMKIKRHIKKHIKVMVCSSFHSIICNKYSGMILNPACFL